MLINISIDNLGVRGSKVCWALEISVHIWKRVGQSGRSVTCMVKEETQPVLARDASLGSECCPR